MRMSCNGCRVLRKGCSEDCTLRPCLQWIKSPESQANATLFLAKFYGRAGLINLINAGPTHLRSETFRSLLYEACGRIINPVYGSVGLMCSGDWPRCQAAVEAVLQGAPLMKQVIGDDDYSSTPAQGQYPVPPLQGCDIRHLSKDSLAAVQHVRTRNRFKRSKSQAESMAVKYLMGSEAKFTITGWDCGDNHKDFGEELKRAPSHDSFSVETVEPTLANRDEQSIRGVKTEPQTTEIGLELTLSLNPIVQTFPNTVIQISDSEQ
ncbi:LOB domain-containing protein 40-like [Sesamum indicum]|uniref:LOB domain-containing protein 40-like n=1 Tax=Sesamum indicum TaxID=4182 RepID=A0A6I9SMQ0_SESIN|nr:LOB domain-containing protein 40-like [Sesamum indicum]